MNQMLVAQVVVAATNRSTHHHLLLVVGVSTCLLTISLTHSLTHSPTQQWPTQSLSNRTHQQLQQTHSPHWSWQLSVYHWLPEDHPWCLSIFEHLRNPWVSATLQFIIVGSLREVTASLLNSQPTATWPTQKSKGLLPRNLIGGGVGVFFLPLVSPSYLIQHIASSVDLRWVTRCWQ